MPRAICLLLAAILLLAQGEARAADPVPIRIGYVVTPPELQPVLFARPEVTKHLGKSYTMEPVHFKSTPVMITALAAGELDVAALTFASFGTAIVNARMTDLRIIADEFQDGVEGYFTEPYLVRRDSGINSVEDLKGKVIASNGIGSGVDMAMRAMLRRHGLEDKHDYSVVEVQFPNMKAVLMERKVDMIVVPAAFAHDPELDKAVRVLFTQREAMGPTQFALWTARTPFLEKNRAAVVDFLEDALRAMHWYLEPANHAAAVGIIADFTHLPAARFDGWFLTHKDQYRDPDGLPNLTALQHNLDTQHELGFLKATVAADDYVDLSLIKEAGQRLR
jgi:ABC-type nitrate/sulfonate/bicarbonate transport system substrate-binding protein